MNLLEALLRTKLPGLGGPGFPSLTDAELFAADFVASPPEITVGAMDSWKQSILPDPSVTGETN